MASNDGTASGAIAALEAKGIAGKIPVSGQDADLIACQYIWKGMQTVTVYKPIKRLAEMAADLSFMAAMGNSLKDSGTRTIQNGGYSISAVFLDPVAVTKENMMETVVADGFHSEEEVKQ